MWKFMPYIAKNLWRNRTRSALTVSGAVTAPQYTQTGGVLNGTGTLTVSGATTSMR